MSQLPSRTIIYYGINDRRRRKLESNLQAKAITVDANTMELQQHSPRALQINHVYPATVSHRSPALSVPVYSLQDKYWRNVLQLIDVTVSDFGVYPAEFLLRIEIDRAKMTMSDDVTHAEPAGIKPFFELPVDQQYASFRDLVWKWKCVPDNERHSARAFITTIDTAAWSFVNSPRPYTITLAPENMFSEKLKHLVDVLKMYMGRDMSGIVFVERKVHAWLLYRLLSQCTDLPHVKPVMMTGNMRKGRYSPDGALAVDEAALLDFHDQVRTMTAFRSGAANLLIATSVAEEGSLVLN
jgi:hypothetical protein